MVDPTYVQQGQKRQRAQDCCAQLHHYNLEQERHSMQNRYFGSSKSKETNTTYSAKNILLILFRM